MTSTYMAPHAVRPEWEKFRHLGYFVLKQFQPKQALSTNDFFVGFESSLMWMFWAFKLSFDVDILEYFFKKLGNILFKFLVTLTQQVQTWIS